MTNQKGTTSEQSMEPEFSSDKATVASSFADRTTSERGNMDNPDTDMNHDTEKGIWRVVIHTHEDNTPAIAILRTGMNKTMKTLERGFGVDISWCHTRIESGDYVLIHTRTSHQTADIYTKGISEPIAWRRLRRLINIFSPTELQTLNLNPDNESYLARDLPDVMPDINDVNPHYFFIMSGESPLTSDLRSAVKQKKPKVKPRPRPR